MTQPFQVVRIGLLVVWGALVASAARTPEPRDLPESAEGTFVQRKVLADVEVTLVSKGTFRFARDRFFEWNTREPVPSTFLATLFSIREMKDFVKKVQAHPATGFPTRVDVSFTNGDRLEIEMVRDR